MEMPGTGALGIGAACEDDAGVGGSGVFDGDVDRFV